MKKIIILIPILTLFLSGCYDMTDIEDIETVTTVYIEPQKITYCTVTTIPDEKKYGYRLYTCETTDLFEGINEISLKTGKKISVAHLDSIIFTKECEPPLIKEVCNSAVDGNDFHPKIMTAFSDMSSDDFFAKLSVPEDTVLYRHISDVFHNKYAVVPQCTVIELYRSLQNENPGVNLPIFTPDANGNITTEGICHISHDKTVFYRSDFAETINLLENKDSTVYYSLDGEKIPVSLTGGKAEYDKDRHFIMLYMEITPDNIGKKTDKHTLTLLKNKIRSDTVKICNEKNNGFDILNLSREMLKKFVSEEEFNRYKEECGGFYPMLKKLNFDVEISIRGEGV